MADRICALLVDDERLARLELRRLLAADPNVEVVGEADGVASASALLRRLRPDVVFLDVQLVDESGFDLLEEAGDDTAVVFVTAYEHHAVRAFEVNALDYLLKPVSPRRLARTLERVRSTLAAERPEDQRVLTLEDRVLVEERGRAELVRVSDILCLRAEDDYSRLVAPGGREYLVNESLRSWEGRLPARHFLRIHRSTLVNLEHVETLERQPNDTYLLRLRGLGEPLAMSRRFASRLRERLG
ncbi:response regulator transcription factor [Pyxidicoccus fallax]|uniref:Response regulator transcription factor n=1 Tax=Pyxidicoccus fallax TaxID=394095 RepID=A0A848L9M9_9BACT|nr:LytTR family DNA-binding domain-containing protein [Pyxidicoccus fallax]NMO15277.1 response regulator transcription factor [Pyxidicoccus fallax]NPC77610.1 response regulator transcription factor [Pyxidicoccus fallax]